MSASELSKLSAAVLERPSSDHAIEFEGHWYSWGDMKKIASEVQSLVTQSGAGATSKIALVAKNRPSAIAAYLGLLQQSFSFRMVYPFQSSTSMVHELEQIKPSVVIAAEETYDSELTDALSANGIAAISLTESSAQFVDRLDKSTIEASCSDQPFIEIHTSGTTGKPKPFVFDYQTIATKIVGGRRTPSAEGADPQSLPPILMYFPTGNITGLHSTITPLLLGQRGVLLDRFNVEGWYDHLKRYQPPTAGLPPAGVQMVLEAELPVEDFRCLRMIGTGSAPLDRHVHRAFEERYGVPILLAYGATEFGGPVTSMTLDLHTKYGLEKLGSVGKPFPGVKLRVMDITTNKELPAGTKGLLEVVSPRVGEDWIRTSDVAYLDADGFLFLCGRADGAIMRGGFKILPETIEAALVLHQAVAAAGVVGVDDHRLGQVPAAAIQLIKGAEKPSFKELEQHLRNHLTATHIPVKWKYVSELPRTASYKVHQPALKELFD